MNYIGIDLGTSSVKGLLMSETLEVISTYSQDYPNNVDNRGWSDQNPEDWYEKSLIVLKKLLTESKEKVASISFSGQMHGMVTLDNEDNVIRPAILWNDQRTVAECEYLNKEIGTDFLIGNTGNIALTGYTAPKVLWMKNNEPELFAKVDKVMLPKDYLSYKLSNVFATDYSDASGTLYLDVNNRQWSKPMLEVLGLDETNVPALYNSYDKVGVLIPELKKLLEIDYDIDIVIGGGDQAVGSVGTGTVKNGDINISLGTSGVVFAAMDEYVHDNEGTLHTFCDATGKYHKMGVALNSGGSMNWWTTNILHSKEFSEMEAEMLKLDPAEKLYYLPYLIGERSPINDSEVRGSFLGLSLHHTDIHLTRSIIEGVSFSIRQMYDGIDLDGEPQFKITGGGANNKLWVQIIADVLGKPINLINASEGPAFGAAILAYSAHTGSDVSDVSSSAVKVVETIYPSSNSKLYMDKYQKWLQIYPIIKTIKL